MNLFTPEEETILVAIARALRGDTEPLRAVLDALDGAR